MSRCTIDVKYRCVLRKRDERGPPRQTGAIAKQHHREGSISVGLINTLCHRQGNRGSTRIAVLVENDRHLRLRETARGNQVFDNETVRLMKYKIIYTLVRTSGQLQ